MTEILREIWWLLKINLSMILKTSYLMMEAFGACYLNEHKFIQLV